MITSTVMEEISIGISHSIIGELIAKKWNFPAHLVESIKYHHNPLSAGTDHRLVVNIVYLSNMLCGIEEKQYNYYYCEESILRDFNVFEEEKFNAFHETVTNKYEQNK